MNQQQAQQVIGAWMSADGGLFDLSQYIGWNTNEAEATLDGRFTADQLEAVAVLMRTNIKAAA